MDSQERQLIVAHIESMNSLTKAITLQSAALLEQNQVIAELANAVGLLVDAGTDHEQQDTEPSPEQPDPEYPFITMMDGTKVPLS
jgi:predicted component of type VI protein secretion system